MTLSLFWRVYLEARAAHGSVSLLLGKRVGDILH